MCDTYLTNRLVLSRNRKEPASAVNSYHLNGRNSIDSTTDRCLIKPRPHSVLFNLHPTALGLPPLSEYPSHLLKNTSHKTRSSMITAENVSHKTRSSVVTMEKTIRRTGSGFFTAESTANMTRTSVTTAGNTFSKIRSSVATAINASHRTGSYYVTTDDASQKVRSSTSANHQRATGGIGFRFLHRKKRKVINVRNWCLM